MPLPDDPRLISSQCINLQPVETLLENPWFSVRKRSSYYTVESTSQQVIILSTMEDSSIIMVRQLRPVINDITLELPAGAVNKDEQPVTAAKRELLEETGIDIKDIARFKPLPPIASSPNRNPCLLYVFHIDIKLKEFESKKEHDDEILSVENYFYAEVLKKIISGEIYASVPMAVIGRFLLNKKV